MNHKRLVKILLGWFLLATMSLLAETPKEFQEYQNGINRETERLGSRALNGNENVRIDAIDALCVDPISPRVFSLLLYLSQDSSLKIRLAAVAGIGKVAHNKMSLETAKNLASSLKGGLDETDETFSAADAWIALFKANCAASMYQLYLYQPILSYPEFSAFEGDVFMVYLRAVGFQMDRSEEFRHTFASMLRVISSLDGLQKMLAALREVLEGASVKSACSVLLLMQTHEPLHTSEGGRAVYESWIQKNSPFLKQLERRIAQSPEAVSNEGCKSALGYLREGILTIVDK